MRINKLIISALVVLVISSCVTQKQLKKEIEEKTNINKKFPSLEEDFSFPISSLYKGFHGDWYSAQKVKPEINTLYKNHFKKLFSNTSTKNGTFNFTINKENSYIHTTQLLEEYVNPVFHYPLTPVILPYWLSGSPVHKLNVKLQIKLEIYDLNNNLVEHYKATAKDKIMLNMYNKDKKGRLLITNTFKKSIDELKKKLHDDYYNIILSLVESTPNSFSPEFINSLDKKKYVTRYVQKNIKKWQQKGEFEKISEYEKRVTDQSRNRKAKEFAQEALAKLGQNIKLDDLKLGEYDAENETYLVRSDYFEDIVVSVSIDNAEEFKNHWDQIKFRNPRYDLDDNKLTLSEVTFHDPVSDTSYDYNRRQTSTYAINQIDYNFDDINYDAPEEKQEGQSKIVEKDISLGQSDIAQQIPETSANNPNAIAIIIGNKDYKHTKDVKYALNDAQIMKQYLIKTLGYKPGNVFYIENATKSNFETYFGTKMNPRGILYNQLKKNQSEVFVYYAGHGAPDLDDHKAYFVPVDCDPNYLEQGGYPRELFYSNISKLPAKNVTVVIDACFSGSEVYEDMSPVMPKVTDPMEKMDKGVVFSSSRGSQVSTWYNEKNHSLFTYFFLKAIKDKEKSDKNNDGKLTYRELYEYISDKNEGLPYHARKIHGVEQEPEMRGQAEEEVFLEY